MTAEITYATCVRSFDHTNLTRGAAYPELRRAISDLANQCGEGVSLADFLEAVRDMALTAPYADCCERCRRTPTGGIAWPHRVDRDPRGWLTCHYRCVRCNHTWTCGYAADFPGVVW
jgi:hypothetical protein